MIIDSVILGLNVTNHVSVHCINLIRSALSRAAEETGSSTLIRTLVSSATKRMHEPVSLAMWYMEVRKAMVHSRSKYRALWNASNFL